MHKLSVDLSGGVGVVCAYICVCCSPSSCFGLDSGNFHIKSKKSGLKFSRLILF